MLRHHYEKLLFPFDLFSIGATYDENSLDELKDNYLNKTNHQKLDQETKVEEKEIKNEDKQSEHQSQNLNGESNKMEIGDVKYDNRSLPRRTSSRRLQGQSLCSIKLQNNKELARLQVFGPGPKMPGFSSNDDDDVSTDSSNNRNSNSKLPYCVQCGDSSFQFQLVTCSTCKNNFHFKCLIPPLNEMPKNAWNCPRCICINLQNQPQSYVQEFGFAQSPRTYSLTEFGEMADKFKSDYFNLPCQAVPLELIEKEFWRLISSMNEEDAVAVEYGADLVSLIIIYYLNYLLANLFSFNKNTAYK